MQRKKIINDIWVYLILGVMSIIAVPFLHDVRDGHLL